MKISKIVGTLRISLIDLVRGTSILKDLKEIKAHQYLPVAEIERIRKERFNELFSTAKNSTKFYKNCSSYNELPVLTKDKIRESFNDFKSSAYPKKLHSKGTGGSTGTPLVYYTTIEAQSYMWAGIILSWQVAGYELGDKVAFIAGTSLFKSSWRHKIFHNLLNVSTYSTFTLNEENIRDYIDKLNKSKTKVIYGYPTALDIMASYINAKGNVSFPHLKGIVSSAEVMTEANRDNIEKAFGVKVYNEYGCTEGGIAAFECEHKRMHLISTRCIYETDDAGNLISTDLINRGFIMMKFFTGDRVEFAENETCACKRNFPIINNVMGRSYDIVVDTKNNVLHAAFFNILFRRDESIKQFQILFDKEDITVYLSVDSSKKEEGYYDKYIDVVKKHLSFKDYKLIINAPFLKTENAKHRYVIDRSK